MHVRARTHSHTRPFFARTHLYTHTVDAKTEANLKQCYNNYCRLTVAGGGKMMMDGDLKISSAQWHQLCADVGLAQPVGECGERGARGGARCGICDG